MVSSVAVAVLAPSGVTALFIPTPIFIPALVIATLRVTTALLVNCLVPFLLPGVGALTRQHLILKHSADVTEVLRRRWACQHSHSNGSYHKVSHSLLPRHFLSLANKYSADAAGFRGYARTGPEH